MNAQLFSTPWLNPKTRQYENVLTFSRPPPGPLQNRVRRVQHLKPFEPSGIRYRVRAGQQCCHTDWGIVADDDDRRRLGCPDFFLQTEDFLDALSQWAEWGYSLDTALTQTLQQSRSIETSHWIGCLVWRDPQQQPISSSSSSSSSYSYSH